MSAVRGGTGPDQELGRCGGRWRKNLCRMGALMNVDSSIPYCGSPPVPGQWVWNTDPVLIGALGTCAALYAVACRRQGAPSGSRQMCFYAGWAITVAALVSPLCNVSVALFSARVTQHMVLTLLAAPLIVLGLPFAALGQWLPRALRAGLPGLSGGRLHAVGAFAFATVLWTWHLPGPYDATLQSDLVYWTMHLTTFGAALLLWQALFRHLDHVGAALLAGLGTTIQMSLLGALLSLSAHPLFGAHLGTTWAWGLSPLDDQQLGGLIMWVPGGVLFTIYSLVALGVALQRVGMREGGRASLEELTSG